MGSLRVPIALIVAGCLGQPNLSFACESYSAAEISSAIQSCDAANDTLKNNSCNFGAAAISESGGNTCASNGSNYGVLQLSRSNLNGTGLTPAQYLNIPMQDQVCMWAQSVGNSNTTGAYQTLANNASIGGSTVTSGMLMACFQFGGAICHNDVAFMQSNGGACPSMANGGIIAMGATLANGTANLDGNRQSICTWGGNIQNNINQTAASCSSSNGAGTKGTQCPGNGAEPGGVMSPEPGSAPIQLPYELS